jgi:hypothetical protein
MAALVATGVAMSGERRVLGIELSSGDDEGSAWPAFIRSLVGRGLRLSSASSHARIDPRPGIRRDLTALPVRG